MAALFGDSSLFDEFDKERPSVATFISYDKNERGELDTSRIIFQCEDSDSGSSSDWEKEAKAKEAGTSEMNTNRNVDEEEEEEEEEMDESDDDENEKIADFNKTSKRRSSTNGEVRTAALKYTNHQLQFEREKLRKFFQKIDSSRCVPDEESPTIQILYQNNDFSRKYRAQIESFVNDLISEHINDRSNEKLPDLQLKATTLTCVDLNKDLNSEQRNHAMWANHAIIGTSHFYIDFQVDTTGWPLVNMNPSLTHSWDIPKYLQVFIEPLPVEVDEEGDKPKGLRPERRKAQCFNCGGEHMMHECKEKKDFARIRMNRQNYMQNAQASGPQKNSRYHVDIDARFASFKPGVISDSLREALGLNSDSIPIYIYHMRMYGYPPGWLEEAKTKSASGMNMFDKHGRQVSVTGATLEEGELEPTVSGDDEIDPSVIIEYPGFTVPLPQGMFDEYRKYEMPPLQMHQLKETLLLSQSTKKRKGENYKNENFKKSRQYDTSTRMDLDEDNNGNFPDYYDLANPKLEESGCFIPPLPSDTPPSRPPLPNDTPPSSGSDFKFSPKNPMPEPIKRRTPLCLPQPKSDTCLTSDSLEDLEAQYRSLQKQLQDEDDSDSQLSLDNQVKASEANLANNPVVLSSDESSHPPSDTGSSSPACTSVCQSVGKDYGTPVHHQKGSFNSLPGRVNFSVGIQDHIPFENLPQSTGTYDRMRKLFVKIKQTMSAKNKDKKSS